MSRHKKQSFTHQRKFLGRPLVRLLLAGVVLAVCALAWTIGTAEKSRWSAEAKLAGRWQRPDGGYIIEIRGVDGRGGLATAYFNPNPIHVARAEWKADHGALAVFIELRDRNYPGATYRLGYVPATDSLKGAYHQPLVGETFEVEFTRIP